MEYRTIFDISTAGNTSWSYPAFGLAFVVLGAALVANRKRLSVWSGVQPTSSGVFAYCFLGFAVLWTVVTFESIYSQYSFLATARSSSDARIVEGAVMNFKPMPVTGHAMERFCVSGACFEYSDYVVAGGFNNTASHGGPIREGLLVRVTYVGNSILKLEVAQ